jgi:hypothetical protein
MRGLNFLAASVSLAVHCGYPAAAGRDANGNGQDDATEHRRAHEKKNSLLPNQCGRQLPMRSLLYGSDFTVADNICWCKTTHLGITSAVENTWTHRVL